ncbi:MAG: DEAD/DEAH box helicase, partial [Acidobacteriaceae bacterium]|nr:DEAD/DEAH box helicase [Acidobacteriaceae bacterium]
MLRSLRVAVRENDFSHSDIALPSTSGGPIASSPLLGHPAPSKPGRVQTWSVPVAVLDPEAAIELLTKTVDKELLEPGVLAGTDLTFWASAMQFAGALVVRQHFLPDLTREDGKFVARWRAAYAGKDDDRLRALTSVMPGAARAVSPDVAQEACVRAFVDTVVDHLVTSGRQAVSAAGATLHDRWIQALEGPDRRLRVKPDEAIEFRRQLREWQRPIAVVSGAPYRLCFRLEAPAEDEAPLWQVRYLLQDRSDPSLLVPAELIWKPKRSRSAVWARSGFNPREHLLFSLGQASSICPPIDESLHSEAPSGYETDATGAFDFLSTKALALEEAGFSVMVPGWWSRKGTRARLSARARVKSPFEKGGGLSLNEVLDFKWEISMGGEAVTLRELKALADLKTPLVKFRGQWVHVSSDEVQAALNFWKKSDGQITAREAVQMAVGASSAPIPIEFAGVQAEGWIGELIRKLEGHVPFEELLQPQGLNAALRPYQVRGYSWLNFLHQWGFGACLADDMGLGKTIQTLSLILRDWRNGVDRPVLLVCPTSVVSNWQKEAARFTPELPVMIHHGAARAKGESFLSDASKHAMVVSSYSLLHRDLEHFKEVKWAGVILDEAQNIKNPETKQAAAARSLAADYRIALTGTPVENNVGDLWSMMEFLNPGVLGTRIEFKRNFYLPIQTGQDAEAMARLKRVTGPF